MSRFHDHNHTEPRKFTSAASEQSYGAIVGTIDQDTEHPIQGKSGDHLQFYVEIGGGSRYQVDINTQSSDGTDVDVYIADEGLASIGNIPDQPFGAPAYGFFPNAKLSYRGLGLTDDKFSQIGAPRIESQLEAALNQAEFVAIYGQVFDDGGADGKGIHETHYTGRPNQDGAIAVYIKDPTSGTPKRTWFFFKFENDNI